jgi:hypothetical protein
MKERLLDVMKIGLIVLIVGAVFYVLTILLKTDPLTVISRLLTTIATIAIAVWGFLIYRLASKFQSRDEEYKQQLRDYFEATVISNILSASQGETGKLIKRFQEHYTGRTKIFY